MVTGKAEYFSSCCAFEHIIWIIAFIRIQPISEYYLSIVSASRDNTNQGKLLVCQMFSMSVAHLKCEMTRL